jgi:hypothetical protein
MNTGVHIICCYLQADEDSDDVRTQAGSTVPVLRKAFVVLHQHERGYSRRKDTSSYTGIVTFFGR